MATTSTNTTKKPILIIKSPENPSKTSSRNVRFSPEIVLDDGQTKVLNQDSLTSQSATNQIEKLSLSTSAKSNRKMKSNRQYKKSISTPRNKK